MIGIGSNRTNSSNVTTAPEFPGKVNPVASRAWPPLVYWMIPFGVALIGLFPRLWQMIVPPAPGSTYMGQPYLPMDFLVYEAFIRQVASNGNFFLWNPFTTEPQSARFILPFHWILGQLSALFQLSPSVTLEVARIALVFVFFGVLWWFLRPILTDDRDRRWAAILLGFAGGFESWIQALVPSTVNFLDQTNRFAKDTWTAYGWNFLASSFNPLWLAGIILALVVLRYAMAENALATARDRMIAGAAFFVLYWVHPYSAVGTLGIIGMRPCVEWFVNRRLDFSALRHIVLTFILPLAAIAAIAHWQTQDPVYRAASGGFFGSEDVSVFWYPLTLGAVGFMALCGSRDWASERHPWRLPILAWVIAIVFLHSSPLFNGYHFVYLLPIPLCIVAAASVRKFFESSRRWARIALALALFGAPFFIVIVSLKTAEEHSTTSADAMRLVATLGKLPDGNAMVPPPIGNIVPARTGHRVWLGHWFLTPNKRQREAIYHAIVNDPAGFPELEKLLQQNQIRYFVVPSIRAKACSQRLGTHVESVTHQGLWTLLTLRWPAT
jgi:hypothetical protein